MSSQTFYRIFVRSLIAVMNSANSRPEMHGRNMNGRSIDPIPSGRALNALWSAALRPIGLSMFVRYMDELLPRLMVHRQQMLLLGEDLESLTMKSAIFVIGRWERHRKTSEAM